MIAATENEKDRLNRRDLVVLLSLIVIALAIRLPRLTELDVWFDEVALLFQTQMSFSQIWNFCKNENFPPLYGWILKLWGALAPGENWLRLLSALLGSLIPSATYLLGKEIKDRNLGLWLAATCVLSLPLVYYSQIIRMYALFVLLACCSYYCFLKAIDTNRWKHWWLMGLCNLLAFYTFLFAVFMVAAQFLIIIWWYRRELRKLYRPFVSHLPAFILMSLWIITLMQRYQKVYEFVPWKLNAAAVARFGTYMGTGISFGDNPFWSLLLNIPFIIGFLLSIPQWRKSRSVAIPAFIFSTVIGAVAVVSVVGHSMFFGRYFLFILPLYLGLVIYGWLSLKSRWKRTLGIAAVFIVLITCQIYYQVDFRVANDYFRYTGPLTTRGGDDGKSLSRIAALLKTRLAVDEIIIHYSKDDVRMRSLSFFPSLYYHQRQMPEYLYSEHSVPSHCGGQYLKQGEWIKSLEDLKPSPSGVWLVTWDDPALMDFTSEESQRLRGELYHWSEDLPLALFNLGYQVREHITDGAVSTVHFVLSDSQAMATDRSTTNVTP
jgi:hypothetical protein